MTSIRKTCALYVLIIPSVIQNVIASPPPMELGGEPSGGLVLAIRLSEYEYMHDEMVMLDARLWNTGRTTVTVCSFPLEFTLSAKLTLDGKNIFDTADGYVYGGDFSTGTGGMEPFREDFIELRPGESMSFGDADGKILLADIISRHLNLRKIAIEPGTYRFTLRFSQQIFDGEKYGITSWKGVLISNAIPLRIRLYQDTEKLISGLSDNSPAVRARSSAVLGRREINDSLEGIISNIKYPDEEVRLNAVTALGLTGSESVVDELVELLDDSEEMITGYAVTALGKIGDDSALNPLLILLNHESAWIRKRVVEAIGENKSPAHIADITRILQDASRSVRYSAVEALSSFFLYEPARRRIIADALISACGDEYFEIRASAIKGLSQYMDITEVYNTVVHALTDRNRFVRLSAVNTLLNSESQDTIKLLAELVNDVDPEIRRTVRDILKDISDDVTGEFPDKKIWENSGDMIK